MQHSAKNLSSLDKTKFKKQENRVLKKKIYIADSQIEFNLALYKWRSNCDFPIVKASVFSIQHQPTLSCHSVSIQNEPIIATMDSLSIMKLRQVLYILRESLRGFQQIYEKLGGFQITSKMICFNQSLKCRVWCNEKFHHNHAQFPAFLSKKIFLKTLFSIVEAKCQLSILRSKFFAEFCCASTFEEGINAINRFSFRHYLNIPDHIQWESKVAPQFYLSKEKSCTQLRFSTNKQSLHNLRSQKKQPTSPRQAALTKRREEMTHRMAQYRVSCKNIPIFHEIEADRSQRARLSAKLSVRVPPFSPSPSLEQGRFSVAQKSIGRSQINPFLTKTSLQEAQSTDYEVEVTTPTTCLTNASTMDKNKNSNEFQDNKIKSYSPIKLIEQNGWKWKVNTLFGKEIDINSETQGEDELADHLLMPEVKLEMMEKIRTRKETVFEKILAD